MTTSMSAFGRASAFGTRKTLTTVVKLETKSPARSYTSNGNGASTAAARSVDTEVQRGLVLDVLTANATKRDAKQYLARFGPQKKKSAAPPAHKLTAAQEERNARHRSNQDRLDRMGVNLGGLYAPARAIAETPQFTKVAAPEESIAIAAQELHIALVCLRAPETLDDVTLDGVALTLIQLVKLDMRILLVLDGGEPSVSDGGSSSTLRSQRAVFANQAERLCAALSRHGSDGGRIVSSALECLEPDERSGKPDKGVSIALPKLLLEPLNRGIIPVIPSLVYTTTGQLTKVPAASVMSALARGISNETGPSNAKGESAQLSLDRVILLDSLGGIPSKVRGDGAHIFINLEQEYNNIKNELADYGNGCQKKVDASKRYDQHLKNLSMARDCLALLPAASSALIVTPQEAATSSQSPSTQRHILGAGTRRQKNTLIHNLLTNKPTVSSSLPVARLPSALSSNGEVSPASLPTSTLLKRGMPLTIIPAIPHGSYWTPPIDGTTPLSLADDPRVDLPRLVHLIESSFRRKLDVAHYLARIQGRVAGLIIAGEYEGGAILTWESPPPQATNPNATSTSTSTPRLVPYLDKFAVLPSSQGSSGVADVLFQAMVRTCFPTGVCWRSRRDNPVNKWYFERSAGTWEIPNSQWTMFWTGEGVVEDRVKWEDYVGVCRAVVPSWADVKAPD